MGTSTGASDHHKENNMKMMRTFFLGLLALLPFLGLDAAAAQSAPAPRISGFEIQQVRRLVPGSELDFTVYGTPGARAVLHIDGVERTLLLDEARAGVYQGTYVISSRDVIKPDSSVSVNLRIGNQSARAVLDESLVQGTRPRPASGGSAQARIERFDVVPIADLRGGNELPFTLYGTPGGQASVSFAGLTGRFFLDEVRPGEYSGAYTIRNSDRFEANSPVLATLRVGDRITTAPLARSLVGMPPPAQARRNPEPGRAGPGNVICDTCGLIEAVNMVEIKSQDNTLGTIAGGVVGAIVGSQVGNGNGTRLAQVAGALGGAYAGNRIQANANKAHRYDVVVRLQAGTSQVISFEKDPGYQIGERVRLVNGVLTRDQ